MLWFLLKKNVQDWYLEFYNLPLFKLFQCCVLSLWFVCLLLHQMNWFDLGSKKPAPSARLRKVIFLCPSERLTVLHVLILGWFSNRKGTSVDDGKAPHLSKGEKREATNGVAPLKTLQFFSQCSTWKFCFLLGQTRTNIRSSCFELFQVRSPDKRLRKRLKAPRNLFF